MLLALVSDDVGEHTQSSLKPWSGRAYWCVHQKVVKSYPWLSVENLDFHPGLCNRPDSLRMDYCTKALGLFVLTLETRLYTSAKCGNGPCYLCMQTLQQSWAYLPS